MPKLDMKELKIEAGALGLEGDKVISFNVKFDKERRQGKRPFYYVGHTNDRGVLYDYVNGLSKLEYNTSDYTRGLFNRDIDNANLGMIIGKIKKKHIEDVKKDGYLYLEAEGITRIPDSLVDFLDKNFTQKGIEIEELGISVKNSPVFTYITPKLSKYNIDSIDLYHTVNTKKFGNCYDKGLEKIFKLDDSTKPLIKKMLENSKKQKQSNVVSIDKGKDNKKILNQYNHKKTGSNGSSNNSSYSKKNEKKVKKKKTFFSKFF